MDKEQIGGLKGMIILGIITVIAGMFLIYGEQTVIGISSLILGAGLALTNYKNFKKN